MVYLLNKDTYVNMHVCVSVGVSVHPKWRLAKEITPSPLWNVLRHRESN